MRTEISVMAAATVAVCVLTARLAAAQDVHCPPHRGETTVKGNLLVAAPCELDRTRVNGNVELYAGGSLSADNARIDGNLVARTAFEVELVDSRIRGNIELVGLVGDSSTIVDSRVDGSILLRSNRSFVQLDGNEADHIEAFGNTGGLDLFDNTVDGDLKCRDNNPAPTGGANEVRGSEEGQCRNLVEFEVAVPADSGGAASSADSSAGGSAGGTSGTATSADSSGGGSAGGTSGTGLGPFNPVNPPMGGGGGGSTDPLTLLAAVLLLLGRHFGGKGRERRLPQEG